MPPARGKADPSVVVRIGYSNDFVNAAKCKRVALSQIAQGSGVVFNVAGACGLGTLQAAKEKGVWAIGVDIDQSYLGRHILTSAVIRRDRGVFDSVQRLVRGNLTTGGNTVFDLRNGFVGLGRISPEVPCVLPPPRRKRPQGDHRGENQGAERLKRLGLDAYPDGAGSFRNGNRMLAHLREQCCAPGTRVDAPDSAVVVVGRPQSAVTTY